MATPGVANPGSAGPAEAKATGPAQLPAIAAPVELRSAAKRPGHDTASGRDAPLAMRGSAAGMPGREVALRYSPAGLPNREAALRDNPAGLHDREGALTDRIASPPRGQVSGSTPGPKTAPAAPPGGAGVTSTSALVLQRVDESIAPAATHEAPGLSALPLVQSAATAGPVAMVQPVVPQDARAVASQLAEAFVAAHPDGAVEIALDPVELGRVRMVLSPDGNALAVVLSAERPETLDLLRRAIDSLASDLRELGYGTLSFRFDQSGNGSKRPDGSEPTARDGPTEPEATGDLSAQSARRTGFERLPDGVLQRLDIRL